MTTTIITMARRFLLPQEGAAVASGHGKVGNSPCADQQHLLTV
ncbi:hypothetical protein SynA1825c_00574 [Synechococcus sp. A18-25c]|nr:hypothetical protein SynA1560_00601 [Synechococcus sp. A15-60]QNJ18896.1 hypothetical protein SynA1825c_00574 [Synechococcus sp. A18-25c]